VESNVFLNHISKVKLIFGIKKKVMLIFCQKKKGNVNIFLCFPWFNFKVAHDLFPRFP